MSRAPEEVIIMRIAMPARFATGLITLGLIAGCGGEDPEAELGRELREALEQAGEVVEIRSDQFEAEVELACGSASAEEYRANSSYDFSEKGAEVFFDGVHDSGACT